MVAASPESNTVVATAVLASAVMMDAFTAHDGRGAAEERPTSLRSTAIVLILCVAGPPLRDWLAQVQRVVLLALLAGVAMLGQHVAAEPVRVGDALYLGGTVLVLTLTHRFLPLEMADKRVSKGMAPWARRDSTTALPCALLFYAGLRQVRASLQHGVAAAAVRTASEQVGYAHASGMSALSLAFSGGAAAAVAALVMLSDDVRAVGTAAAAPTLLVGALAQVAGAFVATMSFAEQVKALPVLFAPDTCMDSAHAAATTACAEARAARRLAQVNTSPALAWLAALGTFVLAFAPSLRPGARGATVDQAWVAGVVSPSILYPVLAAVACIWSVQVYCSFEGVYSTHEWAVVVAIIGAFATPFFDSLTGGLMFAGALLVDQTSLLLEANGAAYVAHPTFSALLITVGALVLHLLGGSLLECTCTWKRVPDRWVPVYDAAHAAVGVLAVAGTSVAVLLFCGSATLFGTFSGTLPPETWLRGGSDDRWARSIAGFTAVHFLPAIVWLGCIATRCEATELSVGARAVAWVVAGLATPLLWGLVRLLVADEAAEQLDSPSHEPLDQTVHRLVSVGPFWAGIALSTFVPWAALAFA